MSVCILARFTDGGGVPLVYSIKSASRGTKQAGRNPGVKAGKKTVVRMRWKEVFFL